MQSIHLREPAQSTKEKPLCFLNVPVEFSVTPTTFVMLPEHSIVFAREGIMFGNVFEFLVAVPSLEQFDIATAQTTSGTRIWNFIEAVNEMKNLGDDWNGHGSEPPSAAAIEMAQRILLSSTNRVPNRVAPSAQGGVGICFYRGDKYGDIECLNTGEILAATTDGRNRPQVWEVAPNNIQEALERIGRFVTP